MQHVFSGRIVDTPKGHSAFIIEGGGPGASLGGDDSADQGDQKEVKMRAVGQQMRQVSCLKRNPDFEEKKPFAKAKKGNAGA